MLHGVVRMVGIFRGRPGTSFMLGISWPMLTHHSHWKNTTKALLEFEQMTEQRSFMHLPKNPLSVLRHGSIILHIIVLASF